ncbi:YkgJ family cysteine cluster protein [Parasulfuritortus cantonensis]|uniref:YkgJ family cysteine cluster protein n=1 Tax=Parasulfuritortus cantonensis TaxID=2528202 RepID=A0A4R1B762_9PROT|nr:YkgJ family cysteine cluster protein [Parasulfuritortus cantonensis]TCJ11503.1 YkgJ family cysteine cluster protein [Parasulfuritortus cantonensis]
MRPGPAGRLAEAEAYDCQSCGACCCSPWTGDGYVRLYEHDVERLLDTAAAVVMQRQGDGEPAEFVAKLATRIEPDGRRVCVAFAGRLSGPCACTVYPVRPEACRRFFPGDGPCPGGARPAGGRNAGLSGRPRA